MDRGGADAVDVFPIFPVCLMTYSFSLNLATYNMEDVALTPRYPGYEYVYQISAATHNIVIYVALYCRLDVKGLGEGRPSVIVGDLILVKHSGDRTDTWYEACVHHITGVSVRLRFNKKFTAYPGARVDVRFVFNRLPDRRMHQAVSAPFNPPRLLFPRPEHISNLRKPSDHEIESITLVDRTLAKNREQLETVAAIVNRPLGSVPFIVFGP